LKNLALLVATLYGALIVFVLVILVPIGLIIKLNFGKFINAVSEPLTLAFSTATSKVGEYKDRADPRRQKKFIT